jgi:preprotein translocase subunit SecA
MFGSFLTKIFGSKYERDYRRMAPLVEEVNQHFAEYQKLSEEELRGKTSEFKKRLAESETVDDLLPEAFATVKETCRRLLGKKWPVVGIENTWDMVPFDVQLMGGIVLHEGRIAEMATGEGKTLVATLPMYLNALPGKGAHLVTVNDYLARRDSEWMGEIYKFLGLTVGCIYTQMEPEERRRQYNCDITYGTNNEFGFDYLRDNMAVRVEDKVQRGHYYAIVDEVDSVLIDEARTPLIISGAVEHSTQRYNEMKVPVERAVNSQTLLVNKILSEAEEVLEQNKPREAYIKLLQVQRGAPKNKRFMKLLNQDPGLKKEIQRVEAEYLRDKRLHEVDEELYFAIDEKNHTVDLTEKGRKAVSPRDPDMFVLPDLAEGHTAIDADPVWSPAEKLKKKQELEQLYAERSERVQNASQILRAYSLFEKDVEYVVTDGKVLIVDEFTGRLMPGRRYSDGLHQALEAKEGVAIERETQTLATITIQNYFRMYQKLAGMTGTAETEATEFFQIYKLDVTVIPSNKPVRRVEYHDVVYRTKREKYNAVVEEVAHLHEAGRPVLVGTVSVEVSETLSRMLQRRGIKHTVLNAKYHQKEAEIVAYAGQKGAVTIATNMAGRGTDIKLETGVVKDRHCDLIQDDESNERCPFHKELKCEENVPCGLRIIGTERHEARRIDRQLRGRSGRQGDPGSSRFYLSLEDDLMRLFGSERIAAVMDRMGAEEGEVIEHPLVTKSIQRAQKRVEERNFDIRKHLLDYDDVMNKQREVIYALRNQVLEKEDVSDKLWELMSELAEEIGERHTEGNKYPENWDWDGIRASVRQAFAVEFDISADQRQGLVPEDLKEEILKAARAHHAQREELFGPEIMRKLEKMVMLQVIDERWRDHLYSMDLMKEGIGLRAYGQKDPLLEYKEESFKMFIELSSHMNQEIAQLLFRAQIAGVPEPARPAVQRMAAYKPGLAAPEAEPEEPMPEKSRKRKVAGPAPKEEDEVHLQPVRSGPKVGRNDTCPCGSGKKYKKCHGK